MPQPFSTKKLTKIFVGDTMAARPKIAAAALEIIAAAARAEVAVGTLLVSLSPQNGRRLAEYYNSQENESRKSATIQATAAVLLSESDQSMLDRILAKHKAVQKERNPFAHWIYAYAHDRDDLLVLVNPKDELLAEAERMFIQHNWMGPNFEAKSTHEREVMQERYNEAMRKAMQTASCYDLNELEKIATRLRAICVCLNLFKTMVTRKGAARDAIFQSLETCLLDFDSPTLRARSGGEMRAL